MSTPVAFDSVDDFDRHDNARADVEAMRRSKARLPADLPWYRPGAATTKTWVEITGPRIHDDYRVLYPAKFVSFDETETSSSSAPKWDEFDEPEELERICVCVVPNGAALKKFSRHAGEVYATVETTKGTLSSLDGTLVLRNSNTSGDVQFAAADHGLMVGQVVELVWDSGTKNQHTTIEAVDGDTITVGGVSVPPGDDNLPSADTLVTVQWYQVVEVALVMVDVSDASAIVRVTTTVRDPDTGYSDAVIREPEAHGNPNLVDGERIWVRNFGVGFPEAGHYTAEFVTRLPNATGGGRAVYVIVTREDTACDPLFVKKRDCISVSGDVNTMAYWQAAENGWVFNAPAATGDGDADLVLREDEYNRLVVEVVSANATWYLNPTGKCRPDGSRQFVGKFTPTELEPEPAEADPDDPYCDTATIEVWLTCVPCTIMCGASVGPFPSTMCVATPTLAGPPSADPSATSVWCGFFFNAVFTPATLSFNRQGVPWGRPGIDYPATVGGVSITNIYGYTEWPQLRAGDAGVGLQWFGTGTVTVAAGTFTYAVQVYVEDAPGCVLHVRYVLPYVTHYYNGNSYLYLTYIVVEGGTIAPADLPPLGNFPLTPTAGTVPYTLWDNNSGYAGNPCFYGIALTLPYFEYGGGGGNLSVAPTVYAGGCADDGESGSTGDGGPTPTPGACPPCVAAGNSATVVITGGSYAGSYPTTWVDEGGGVLSATITLSGMSGTLTARCGGALGWTITSSGLTVGAWTNSAVVNGPPASITYDGTGTSVPTVYGPGGTVSDPVTSIVVATC